MLLRIFVGLIVLVAIAVGGFALTLPRDEIVRLIVFRDFFDVSLPILAFGALIKYLCTCRPGCNCKCCKKNMGCNKAGCTCSCGCCNKSNVKPSM